MIRRRQARVRDSPTTQPSPRPASSVSRTIRTRSDTVISPVRWPRKERLSWPAISRLELDVIGNYTAFQQIRATLGRTE